MGSYFSSPPSSTTQLQTKDVLALCEDGDLLLAREKLADSALRVGVEFVVARDIERMQHGQFPAQRVTSLPPWTSCELMLRHEGALHVVSVSADGLHFVPFEERVASKLPHIHDRFAVRRLQYDTRTDTISSTLRDLASQIAVIAPISWHTLLFPSTGVKMTPRSPLKQPVDREAVVDALKELPPLIQQLLRQTLEGLKVGDTTTDNHQSDKSPPSKGGTSTDSPRNIPSDPNDLKNEDGASETSAALENLGFAEVTARLSAAFVAAVYELVGLLDPITINSGDPLLPSAFWSSSNDNNRRVLIPSTALGLEMALIRPKST